MSAVIATPISAITITYLVEDHHLPRVEDEVLEVDLVAVGVELGLHGLCAIEQVRMIAGLRNMILGKIL
jgi:hypothetical protein